MGTSPTYQPVQNSVPRVRSRTPDSTTRLEACLALSSTIIIIALDIHYYYLLLSS
jgi:hypothetical protein